MRSFNDFFVHNSIVTDLLLDIKQESPSNKMYLMCMCARAWARVFKNDVITTVEYVKYTTQKKLGTSMKNWWSFQVRINSVFY